MNDSATPLPKQGRVLVFLCTYFVRTDSISRDKPLIIGSSAISCAQCLPGTNRTSLAMFPIVMYTGHALTFPDVARCVLSDVKIIGTTVADSGETSLGVLSCCH